MLVYKICVFPFLCLMPLSALALIAEHNYSVFSSVTFFVSNSSKKLCWNQNGCR